MSALVCIAPDVTVRQVASASPGCARILERYPGARFGGAWSLQDLGPFARDAGLDAEPFFAELAAAASLPLRPSANNDARRAQSPMPLIFTALATGLGLGTAWGVGLLLRIALGAGYEVVPARSVHVHGLAQLWGWLALFVFGVGSHLLRQNTKRPAPAWLDYAAGASVVAGLLVVFATMSASVRAAFPHAGVLGSALLALGALCFAVSAIVSLLGRHQRPLLWHGFVFATIAWLLAWAGTDLFLRAHHPDEMLLPDSARGILILLPVLGFAANAIYGFGIRLIPGLLNLGRLRPRCFAASLLTHNLGLALLLAPPRATRIAGSTLMIAAAVAYLFGMNGLRSKPSRPLYGVDARGHILIRAAFFWLICGLTMLFVQQLIRVELPHAYSGAWRHALTVGFVTTMILGVAHRMAPIFIKQPLASTRLMLVSAALILIGNAGRVILELATIGGWRWTFRLMGITGVLELTALLLFALNLAATARNRRRAYRAAAPLTPDTRVRDAVNVRPQIQQQLRDLGVTMFDGAPFIAPSLTFGALALAWGLDPQHLLDSLRAAPQTADSAKVAAT